MIKYLKSKQNNKGSGIVTVLIAVSVLSLVGSMILLLASTDVEIKVADLLGKQTAYDAATAMDEIRAGVQVAVSDSINVAYSDEFKYYGEGGSGSDGFQKTFLQAFTVKTLKWEYNKSSFSVKDTSTAGSTCLTSGISDASITNLFTNDMATSCIGTWNAEVLRLMIKNCREGEVTVTSVDPQVVVTKENITLKNVKVTLTKDNKTSSVTTDLVIDYPNVSYSLSQFSMYGVPSFSVIVDGTIKQNCASTTRTKISGNAYAGSVNLSGDSQIYFTGDNLVVKGDIDISGNYGGFDYSADADLDGDKDLDTEDDDLKKARLYVPGYDANNKTSLNSKVWANNINVKGNSSVAIIGETYVGNDLNVTGKNSTVTLGGSYYGYGTGYDLSDPDYKEDPDPSRSSAILINAKNTKLKIDKLTELFLAGFSFVGKESTDLADTGNVKMGESTSVKVNQKAYLVPVDYLKYTTGTDEVVKADTNPEMVTEEEKNALVNGTSTLYLDTTSTIWQINGVNKKYSDYGAQLQYVITPFSGKYAVYFFLRFDLTASQQEEVDNITDTDKKYEKKVEYSNENANRYIKDYIAANPGKMEEFVTDYLTLTRVHTNALIYTMGTNFTTENEPVTFGSYLSGYGIVSAKSDAELYGTCHSNLCQTLDEDLSSSGDTPYTYYIDSAAIADKIGTGKKYFYTGGATGTNPLAVIVNGNYTYDTNENSSIRLIIATGNVTVSKDFEGLIICGGDLDIGSNVNLTPNAGAIQSAYVSENNTISDTEYTQVRDYFKTDIGDYEGATTTEDGTASTVAKFVTYKNWKKD